MPFRLFSSRIVKTMSGFSWLALAGGLKLAVISLLAFSVGCSQGKFLNHFEVRERKILPNEQGSPKAEGIWRIAGQLSLNAHGLTDANSPRTHAEALQTCEKEVILDKMYKTGSASMLIGMGVLLRISARFSDRKC